MTIIFILANLAAVWRFGPTRVVSAYKAKNWTGRMLRLVFIAVTVSFAVRLFI